MKAAERCGFFLELQKKERKKVISEQWLVKTESAEAAVIFFTFLSIPFINQIENNTTDYNPFNHKLFNLICPVKIMQFLSFFIVKQSSAF